MSTFDKKKETKTNSKKGLGRGLSSLLPTEAFGFGHIQDSLSFEQTEKPSDSHVPLTREQRRKTLGRFSESREEDANQKKSINNNNLEHFYEKIIQLSIEKLIPSQNQPRKDFLKEPLEELASSIKEQGVLQPITVRKRGDGFEIIAGERRFRASQMAGLKEVPVILKENIDDQKSMELALIENLQREDLNVMEEALGYQHLMDDYQLSQKELALKIGKKRSSIANVLRILTLPQEVKEMLKRGALSFGHGKVLLSVDDSKKQNQFARKTVEKNLSVRDLEKEVKKERDGDDPGKTETNLRLNGWIPELEKSLQRSLGTKVGIQYKKGKGQIRIAFYSDEELSQFYEKFKDL